MTSAWGWAYDQAAEAYPTALGERGPALGVVFQWPEQD